MDKLQVVMPMAGLGQRFKDSGYEIPKPLILVDEKPMFLRALDSLVPLKSEISLSVVIRSDTNLKYPLEQLIKRYNQNTNVIVLEKDTKGACETALAAKPHIDPDLPLLILDCDLFFRSDLFAEYFNSESYKNFDGMLISFESNDPRYSYVQIEDNLAIKCAEKSPISSHALVGSYFWTRASDFLKHGEECVSREINQFQIEYYISSAIQIAILEGLKFLVVPGDFDSFGTPMELSRYFGKSNKDKT